MRARVWLALGLVIVAVGGAFWLLRAPRVISDAALAAHYATPLIPPEGVMSVYHLGHSLVGRDMPAMLAQMAGHDYASQLGWGASITPLSF